MKKTKKQLEEIVKETDDRNARLSIELRAARQLNDELRETLIQATKERDAFSQGLKDLNRHCDKREDRLGRLFRTTARERRTWRDLFAAEIADRSECVTLIRDLRSCVQEAVQNISRLQTCVRTLNKNRVDSADGVYVKSSDIVELVYATNQIDHFVKGTELEQLLEESSIDSTDE